MVNGSRRLQRQFSRAGAAVRTLACAAASDVITSRSGPGDTQREQVRAAETRLLYENAGTGTIATILIASLLAYSQQQAVTPPLVVATWSLYMLLVAAARFMLARCYWRASPSDAESRRWNVAFVV